jgi:hypothetical protein
VLREQLRESKTQAAAMQRQVFDGAFFGMLGRLQATIDSVRSYKNGEIIFGRMAIASLYAEFSSSASSQHGPNRPSQKQSLLVYEGKWRDPNFASMLGPYFRVLYHTFKMVDSADLPNKDKVIYANLIRAQLSGPEISLLYYNALSDQGRQNFKPLIEKYGVLKHLDRLTLVHGDTDGDWHAHAFRGAEGRL